MNTQALFMDKRARDLLLAKLRTNSEIPVCEATFRSRLHGKVSVLREELNLLADEVKDSGPGWLTEQECLALDLAITRAYERMIGIQLLIDGGF